MSLRRIPQSKVWIFQCKINGKVWSRSTRQSDRKKAEKEVPRLQKLAQLFRERPNGSLRLSKAITQEVARVETDVSVGQADRVSYALMNFLRFAGDILLERVDRTLVEDYQRKRLKEISRSTADKEICYLLRLLRLNGFMVQRPSAKPGKATPNRAFAHEELARFLKHVPERLLPLCCTLLVTGARPAELVPSDRSTHKPLLKSEVDLEKRTIQIRSAKGRLNGMPKTRQITVPGEIIPLLQRQISRTPPSHPYVFEKLHNAPRDFNTTLKRARIERIDPLGRKLTFHSFRHTYATLMAEATGHNPFVLKEILGHQRLSTTERYCHPTAPVVPIRLIGLTRVSRLGVRSGCKVIEARPEPKRQAQ